MEINLHLKWIEVLFQKNYKIDIQLQQNYFSTNLDISFENYIQTSQEFKIKPKKQN